MGSGPEDKTARRAGGTPPVDPALLARPEVRAALASHDIGALFRVLGASGWSQRDIARVTGMHQSDISAIVNGRRVGEYRVLMRIADGLGVPRALMNLGPADGGSAYAGGVTDLTEELTEEVDAEMRRRVMLAAAGATIAGQPIPGIGEVIELPGPSPVPPPSRIFEVHVAKVRNLHRKLGEASRAFGSDPQMSSGAAAWATRLLDIPGAEPIKRDLMEAVAGLHLQAGYAAFDAGLDDRTLYHYTVGLQLATEIGDAYLQTLALDYAGWAIVEQGHPNDGLKLLQFGLDKARDIPAGDQRRPGSPAALKAWGYADSAIALTRLGRPEAADAALMESRELWRPTPADPNGDLDRVAARLEFERGRLEVAQGFAAASVRRWEGGSSRRARTLADVLLATIHVQAGDPDGLRLAHGAITSVTRLSSFRARQGLIPLAVALESRTSSDHRQLAQMARHVATTRA
jgi:transcriptional regulator with XRE-family HTH domain